MYSKKNIVLLILMLLNPISGVGIDIYAPSLPYIVSDIHTTSFLVQLTMSIYVAGFGIGQIIIGNLADSIGRKPVLLVGLFLFSITSILIAFSTNIGMMLFSRFIQGLSVGAPGNLSKTIATDYYSKTEMPQISSYILLAWGIGPIVAPAIGGYLQYHFNWQMNFYCLASYGFFAFLIVLFMLPETNRYRRRFKMQNIIKNHKKVLSSSLFVVAALSMAIGYSFIVLFNAEGPFLIQKTLHYSVIFYGNLALVLGTAFCCGAFSNLLFMRVIPRYIILVTSIVIIILNTSIQLILAMGGVFNLYVIVIPVFTVFYFVGCIYPYYMGICISQFPKMAGVASSISGFTTMLGTAIITAIATSFNDHLQIPFAISCFILGLFLFFMFLLNKKNILGYIRG